MEITIEFAIEPFGSMEFEDTQSGCAMALGILEFLDRLAGVVADVPVVKMFPVVRDFWRAFHIGVLRPVVSLPKVLLSLLPASSEG